MKPGLKISTVCLLLLSTVMVKGAILTRSASGDWNDPALWFESGTSCNCIPQPGDQVEINAGEVTILPTDAITIESLEISSPATLIIEENASLDVIGANGIDNSGSFLNYGVVSVDATANSAFMNNGPTEIYGELFILSDEGIISSDLFTIHEDGLLTFQELVEPGIIASGTARFINYGRIESKIQHSKEAILVYSQFNNYGQVELSNGDDHLIRVFTGATLFNAGNLSIDSSAQEGITNFGTIRNLDTIAIQNCQNEGILNQDLLNNEGLLSIINCNTAISTYGDFTNTDSVKIDSSSTGIFAGSGTVDNASYLSIKAATQKAINAFSSASITNNGDIFLSNPDAESVVLSNGSSLTNKGELVIYKGELGIKVINSQLENSGSIQIDSTDDDAIKIESSGIFDNYADLTIDHSENGLAIMNANLFQNGICGTLTTNDDIDNTGTFDNSSFWFHSSSSSSNTGNLLNNGVIVDPEEDMSGLLSNNNGYLMQPIPGIHCQEDVIDVLTDGLGLGITSAFIVYKDEMELELAGDMDVVNTIFTPYPSSALTDTFYFSLMISGCKQVVPLYFVNPIQARWYLDSDMDGFGDINFDMCSWTQPSGYVSSSTDCNDSDDTIYPDAPELCDGKDNDCDGNPEGPSISWSAGGDGSSWMDRDNWDAGHVPAECQVVYVNSGGATIRSGEAARIKQLQIGTGATVGIANLGELSIDGNFNLPTLSNNGILDNAGRITLIKSQGNAIENSGSILNTDSILVENVVGHALENKGNGYWNNEGYFTAFGSVSSEVIYNEGEILNTTDGSIDVTNNSLQTTAIYNISTSGSISKITNNGNITLANCDYGIYQDNINAGISNASQGTVRISKTLRAGIVADKFTNAGSIILDEIGTNGMQRVELENTGYVDISDCNDYGILFDGIKENNGDIKITDTRVGIYMDKSTFTNYGRIHIDTTEEQGIYLSNISTLSNRGPITISNSNGEGIYVNEDLDNRDSLIIQQNNKSYGILCEDGSIDNTTTGVILLQNGDSTHIEMTSGELYNEGKILLGNGGKHGINTGGASSMQNEGLLEFIGNVQGQGIYGESVIFENLSNGIVSGNGSIKGDIFINTGTLSPGFSPGLITFEGNANLGTGIFECDLDGINGQGNSLGNDAIIGNGDMTISGTLNINLPLSYEPTPGDEFVILETTSGLISGAFTTVNSPSDLCLEMVYEPTRVLVTRPGPAISNWSGTISDDWFDPSNWQEGCVPGPNSEVFIHSALHYPIISGMDANVKSVSTFPGTFLSVKNNAKMRLISN